MALFAYKAVDANGEIVEGQLDAASQEEVIERLYSQGQTPIRADEAGTAGSPHEVAIRKWFSLRDRPSQRDIVDFTRQLATLLGAGLELDRALNVLVDVAEKDNMRKLLLRMQEHIHGGGTLSQAMEQQGAVFSRLYLSLIRAGEASGSLDVLLQRLADYLERSAELRESVVSALIYPAVLLAVAALSILILMTVVLPEFSQLFEDMGATLPLPTQIVIAAGELLSSYGWVLVLALVAAGFIFYRQWNSPPERRKWDALLLRLPLVSDLIVKLEVARFSHTLATLLNSGIPLLTALSIVKNTLNNQLLAENIERVSVNLKQGGALSQPLLEEGLFPRRFIHMLRVGEETGNLEEMLFKVAEVYDREVQTSVKRMLALLEPALILGLGVVVAGIIVSLLLAIMGLNDLPF